MPVPEKAFDELFAYDSICSINTQPAEAEIILRFFLYPGQLPLGRQFPPLMI
jgi:hypothetical protein